ncbi:MAG TPA: biosynthetic-type acetolactate synthase large subunit [Coriobacteriia bacterium]|jgi:acetolactate synthase-1/2/3 large subunit
MRVSGAQALVKALEAEGVDVLFGYPGGVALPIYDAIWDSERLRHILVRHEQGAAHAADGYARATGRPGVCLVTSGPGATNTVTGIANAYMDSIPMVVLTAQVATSVLGTDAFQEVDISGITLPITKHSYLVKDSADAPEVIKEAFHIAGTGRPGPVLVDLPVDVSRGEVPNFKYPETVNIPGYKPTMRGHAKQVKQAAALIAKARKPILYAGGGVIASEGAKELKELAELMQLPVTTTLMGKGGFPEDHYLHIGMPGMHGPKYTNYAMTETDLLIAVGVRFDDRVTGKLQTFATKAKIIHVDIDPAEIGKNKPVDVPIVGDAKNVLAAITAELRKTAAEPRTEKWMRVIDDWRKRYPLHYHKEGAAIMPQHVVERIDELTRGRDVVIATEVGQNQMWACQYHKVLKPRTWLSSGGLGTMGYGLPAAIGAQAGRPDALVIDIAGDGSIQMKSQEMATARNYGLPVKVVVLNNGFLGMVRQWQELFYERHYSQSVLSQQVPDFVKLAEAYDWLGIRATQPSEVDDALTRAFEHDGPALVDCRIEPEENVYPMVAPGGSIDEMLGGIPGGPISEMLDDELLTEVWE